MQDNAEPQRWPWLDKQEQWDKVVEACYVRGVCGCDTETYGHNVKTSTPAFRAKIDVWSLALSTTQLSPRGYHVARACVLPLEAALYPPMKEMLESHKVLHVFHNKNHDQHSFANHGINLGAVYDTLDAVRLLYPGHDEGYNLKAVREWLLGKVAREHFVGRKKRKGVEATQGLTDPLETVVIVTKQVKVCSCGDDKCRKTEAKWGDEHSKEMVSVGTTKIVKTPCPIESIVPGHPRWVRKCNYAGEDAADGLELYEVVLQEIALQDPRLPPLPW